MFKSKNPEKPQQENAKTSPCGGAKNPRLDIPAHSVIAVASGKGGVGKSTVSSNLAIALAKEHGLSVGLLDADIYGPSQPLMMGDESYKPPLAEDKKVIPAQCHGIKVMSIGFVADTAKALIWRGPMAQSAFYQMVRDVQWSPEGEKLDVLVIDLPPGTGDVQLTMIQKMKVHGAVIVSTPQDIALIDARRAVSMFKTMNVPVLGIIENMSVYICPECGHEEYVFGHGGARKEAEKLGVEFLGDIPLSKAMREASDQGTPIVVSDSEDICAGKINAVASKIATALKA